MAGPWDDVAESILGAHDTTLDVDVAAPAFDAGDAEATTQQMRRNVTGACDHFVAAFLAGDGGSGMGPLLETLEVCDDTLAGLQRTLGRYIRRIDIATGALRALNEKARDTAVALDNTQVVQRAVAAAVESVFVPPDTARVIVAADAETGLGPQFVHELRRFEAVLRARRRGVVSLSFLGQSGVSEAELDLTQLPIFEAAAPVVAQLAHVACVKIRNFLIAQFEAALAKPRTNFAVQQHNVLLQHKPMVAFLRHTAPAAFEGVTGQAALIDGESLGLSASNPARALYKEVRDAYVAVLSRVYRSSIHRYLVECNTLEHDWRKAAGHDAAPSTFSTFLGVTRSTCVDCPALADATPTVTARDFALGSRAGVLEDIRRVPVIPHVHRAAQRRHSYEETFRSVNVLLCDAVTSEFLFSFDFFAGDASVYLDVFRPTVQLVVDYTGDVVLRDAGPENRAASAGAGVGSSGFAGCQAASEVNKDYVGLMLLIRLTHLFQANMHTRRLYCFDGYFDSLRMLLWPAFRHAFDRQALSLRSLDAPKTALAFLAPMRGAAAKAAAVHPVTRRYAELSHSLLVLGSAIEAAPPPRSQPSVSSVSDAADGAVAVEVETLHGLFEPDLAESAGHFEALRMNLEALRIDFGRFVNIVADAVALEAAAERDRGDLTVLRAAVAVNNYHHVLSVWSGAAADSARDDDDLLEHHPAPLAPHLVHAAADHAAVLDAFEAARVHFADAVVASAARGFAAVVAHERALEGGTVDDAAVRETGRCFIQDHAAVVEAVLVTARTFVGDRSCLGGVVKQAFTQLLLINSRFHAVVAAGLRGDGALRSVVVTNPVLMQAMRRALATV